MPLTSGIEKDQNVKEDTQSQDQCDKGLEDELRRSASISSERIRSGIGVKDFISLIRESVASKKSGESKGRDDCKNRNEDDPDEDSEQY